MHNVSYHAFMLLSGNNRLFLYSYLLGKLSCDYSSNIELACLHNGFRSAQHDMLFKLPKVISYFCCTARLCNTLPFVIQDAYIILARN